MKTTEEIETDIVNKLKLEISELQVESIPVPIEDYQLLHAVGAVLVQYFGSLFPDAKTLSVISQVRTMDFRVVLVIKNLRTHRGAYFYLDKIRAVLTGFQIQGLSKMQPTKEEYLGGKSGVWYYGTIFTMNGRNEETS